ncbi:GntR family transcriptional regulator [Lactovum odontotermitis]
MAIPLYQKISDDLKDLISNQTIKVGDKLPTEKELSETYNVSRITAKHALNNLEQIGLISRSRGRGSFVKRSSVDENERATKAILFIHPFGDLAFGDFAQGLIPYMKRHGYNVFITHVEFLQESAASEIIQNFDGLIYYPMNTDDYLDTLYELVALNFPVVLLDKEIYGLPFPCVRADNFAGGQLATQRLIDAGHEKIAFMMSGEAHPPHTTRDRYLGYMSALSQAKLKFHTLYSNPQETSRVAVDYLKASGATALVCENDFIALSLLTTLQHEGYKIPQDISIIGFDNIQAASLSNPPLTTVEQNFSKMGEEAAKLMFNWIKTKKIPQNSCLPVQLIERNSVKDMM